MLPCTSIKKTANTALLKKWYFKKFRWAFSADRSFAQARQNYVTLTLCKIFCTILFVLCDFVIAIYSLHLKCTKFIFNFEILLISWAFLVYAIYLLCSNRISALLHVFIKFLYFIQLFTFPYFLIIAIHSLHAAHILTRMEYRFWWHKIQYFSRIFPTYLKLLFRVAQNQKFDVTRWKFWHFSQYCFKSIRCDGTLKFQLLILNLQLKMPSFVFLCPTFQDSYEKPEKKKDKNKTDAWNLPIHDISGKKRTKYNKYEKFKGSC